MNRLIGLTLGGSEADPIDSDAGRAASRRRGLDLYPQDSGRGWWVVWLLCACWPLWSAAAPPLLAQDAASLDHWLPPRLDELDHLSSDDGLSHNTVWRSFQDSRGFMWFVTSSGLNRYDGYRFKPFRHVPGDEDSLISDRVTSMTEDASGALWIGTLEGLDRYDPVQRRFVHYRHDAADDTTLSHDQVLDAAVDADDRLWVATLSGVDVYRPEEDDFIRTVWEPAAWPGVEQPMADVEKVLRLTADGTLWLAVGQYLCRLDDVSEPSAHCLDLLSDGAAEDRSGRGAASADGSSAIDLSPSDIAFDQQGHIWVSTLKGGLFKCNPESNGVERFRHDPRRPDSLGSDQVTSVWVDRKNQLWVGTDAAGLHLKDPRGKGFVRYQLDPFVDGGLSDNGVLDIFEDWQGLLWFTSYLGVDRYDPSREAFRTVRRHPSDPTRLAGTGVWALHRDAADELWVGTYTEGLERFDADGRRLAVYGPNPWDPAALSNGVVSGVIEDGHGDLWVGTWGGLHHFDRREQTFQVWKHRPDDDTSLASHRVYHLLRDSAGGLWVGLLGGGVDYVAPDWRSGELEFIHHRPGETEGGIQGGSVYQTLEDHAGVLWFATSHGLERLVDAESKTFELLTPDEQDPDEPQLTQALYEDADHVLWVGTDDKGLGRLDAQRTSFRRYHLADGLPSESIAGILGDDDGMLWLSTDQGIARFDPHTEDVQVFDVSDGLQGRVYTIGSVYGPSDGELFFGGAGGYDRFRPGDIRLDHRTPRPVLVDFLLFNRSPDLRRRDPKSPLRADIGSLDHLTLTHRDYVLGFEFSGLHFASPERNRFAYQLEGVDPKWTETRADRRFIQYSNLPAGEYVFQVKAANEDGVWSSQSVRLGLTVLPPPWRTWWAYSLYLLALTALIALYVRSQRRKIAHEQALNAQLRDVNRMKDEFLANTSHELRTPLFGIIGITESLLDGVTGGLPAGTRQNLSLISSSARRLGALVNDILDFSKLSGRELKLQRGPVDLHSLCEVVLALSVPLVGSKELEVRNGIPDDLPTVDGDEARLQQILINLVGNAIKFTEAGWVEVSAFVDGDRVEVQVADSGIGVPEEVRESIFQAFEQGDASTERQFGGTGLGLAVTKKLVTLHGGTIGVRTAPQGGAEFFFTLPLSTQPSGTRPLDGEPRADTGVEVFTPQRPERKMERPPLEAFAATELSTELAIELPPGELKILIVDDEPINRQVLRNHLALNQFVVESVSSGPEALRMIDQGWLPDLVLLDVMMPKMSGYEVCTALRERFSTAELPILFLTAKNQPADQVAGLAYGANDYLTKPITKGELLARVKLHLELLWVHRHLEEVIAERTTQIKTLGGLLPICGLCKSVRDDTGYWNQLEDFLRRSGDVMITHGICPTCLKDHYGELFENGKLPGSETDD